MTEKLSLTQKIAKLDSETEWFYSDDFKLDEAVSRYKATADLAKEISSDLDSLQNEIEILSQDFSK